MKDNYRPFLMFELRQDMEKHGFEPNKSRRLKADGKEHKYDVFFRGKKQKAYYEAKIDNFGKKWPVLTANYGDQYENRYFCNVSIYELIKQ